MSKHTQGPWRAIDPNSSAFTEEWSCHEDTHAHSVWQPIVDARCKAVALVVDANSDFGDRASFDADARLIAAAPELLEALRNLYMSAPTSTECNAFHHSKEERHAAFEPCQPAKDYLSALSHARAAILKATGEQP